MPQVAPRSTALKRTSNASVLTALLLPVLCTAMTHAQPEPQSATQAPPLNTAGAQTRYTAGTLLPRPTQVSEDVSDTLPITPSFTVSSNALSNPDLQAAVRRTLEAIQRQTNTPLAQTIGASMRDAGSAATLTIQIANTIQTRPTLTTDESYQIEITPIAARLTAPTVFGAMHGLVTLQQLVQPAPSAPPNLPGTNATTFVLPALRIDDAPRFPWRGISLDVVRHWMPLPVLYRTLDGMAEVKLNVLHLHLSDDQGFRLESKRFPQLTAKGSDGLFYTQAQMLDLIEYARARGIRVVPEFDVPGHVTAWLTAMPQFASVNRKYEIARTFGIWDPALDPTREDTYKFLDTLIGEIAALFPDDFLHMGGDESNGIDWKANPNIVRYMGQHNIANTDALQAYFSTRVLALVKKHGKQMVGWDEILQPNTPRDAVIQSWRGVDSLAIAAKQGNRGILSAPYYLDAMKTAETMYLADPLPAPGTLTPEQEKLILGGEVAMWGEQITPQTVDSRLWPRTAALAERFWSTRQTRDVDSMYARLEGESIRLDGLGLTHIFGPSAGLRQIAGSEAGAQQLAVLTATLSPVPFYERYLQQKTSQLTPMGNVVDYTRPDPALRWRLRQMVDRYLHGASNERSAAKQQLTTLFQAWIATGPALDALAPEHPLLNQVTLRRQQLPQLAQLGLQALADIDNKRRATPAWNDKQTTLLKQAATHTELTDFAILPSLQQLFDATKAR